MLSRIRGSFIEEWNVLIADAVGEGWGGRLGLLLCPSLPFQLPPCRIYRGASMTFFPRHFSFLSHDVHYKTFENKPFEVTKPLKHVSSKAGADPGEGKRVPIPPPSLSLLAVICSKFFVVEVIFFVFLFLLRMTKGDNKKKYQSHVFY